MKPTTARERRLIAVLLLVAAIALLWLGLLSPVIDGFRARSAERQALHALDARNQRLAAGLPLLRATAARQRAEAGRFVLPAATAEQAVTLLKVRLRATARRHGIVTRAVQEVEARPGWAAVRADGVFDWVQFSAFVTDLQNQVPIAPVSSLTVSAEAAMESGRAGPMEVRLEIAAPFAAPGGG